MSIARIILYGSAAIVASAACGDTTESAESVQTSCERSELAMCPINYDDLLGVIPSDVVPSDHDAGGPALGTKDSGSLDAEAPKPDAAAATATISLRDDLLPIFYRSCTQAPCHDGLGAKADLYLGDRECDDNANCNATNDAALVYDSLLGRPSETVADMPLVSAGDPSNSFLLFKVSGCFAHESFTLECDAVGGSLSSDPCGDPMPRGGSLLDICDGEEKFVKIARWIQEGAQNN